MRRKTWQRDAVRDELEQQSGFVSAQGLHTTLVTQGTAIGLATVYRALADLASDGDADSLQSDDGETLYRACRTDTHHHHLICRQCGRTVEIEAAAVEKWARKVASDNSFTHEYHVIDIFGLCPDCAK